MTADPEQTAGPASAVAARARPAHFNHAGASPPPEPVVDRVVAHLRLEADIGGYEAAEEVADDLVEARSAVAQVIGADAADVVLVESATQAWITIVWSLALSQGWGPHDRVVVDNFAYVSSWAVLDHLRSVVGVQIVVAPIRPDGTVDPAGLADLLDDRTRLVLVTHVPTHVGTVTPIDEVAAAVVGSRAVVAFDLSQSVGQLPVDVRRLGCQVAFAPGRKFLRAPRGTGLLYVEGALAATLTPLGVDLTATTSITTQGFEPAPGTARFELFEHSAALRLGMGEAARHLSAEGIDQVAEQVAARTRAVVERLVAVPSLHLVAAGPVQGIVSFTHDRIEPSDVRRRLSLDGINAWTNVANGSPVDGERRGLGPSVRLSPHASTTDDDLDRLERALAGLA